MPAIDILDEQVVRVEQGREETAKAYSTEPIEVAHKFLEKGSQLVHVVDLNAALHNDLKRNSKLLEAILSEFKRTKLRIEVAGGMRSPKRAFDFLERGAARIVLSSLAYSDLNSALLVLRKAGAQQVALALDYDAERKVRTSGWKAQQSERVDSAMARFYRLGFSAFLLTSVSRDGMMRGPDVETLSNLRRSFPEGDARLIASGGISSQDDLRELSEIGIDEAIVGKAIYEGRIPLSVLKEYSS